MKNKLFNNRILFLLLSLVVVLGFLPLDGASFSTIESHAASYESGNSNSQPNDAGLEYRSGDFIKVPMPQVIELGGESDSEEYFLGDNILNGSIDENSITTGAHYEYLTDTEKKLYKAMITACAHVYAYGAHPQSTEEVGCIQVFENADNERPYTQAEFQAAFDAARFDHMDLLQLTLCNFGNLYSYRITNGNTRYNVFLYLVCDTKYNYTQTKFTQMTNELKSIRTAILSDSRITSAKGNIGKELAVHDLLIGLNTYDHECANAGDACHISHTAYGALINHTSVCDGYSMAYSYLLEGLGIESLVVGGTASGGGHAWNLVKHEDNWYEVDSTWDDQELSTNQYSEEFIDEITHKYYHLTTAAISQERHSRAGLSLRLPTAVGTKYTYEKVKELINEEDSTDDSVAVTGITLDTVTIRGTVGDQGTLTAGVVPANATNKAVHWVSSNPGVISVDQNGHYIAKAAGRAEITVTTDDGNFSKTCVVEVWPAQEDDDNEENPSDDNPGSGDQESDDTGNGEVTGIIFDVYDKTIKVGESGFIRATVIPANAIDKAIVWTCSDESVLFLDKSYGFFYGRATGISSVTATTVDGKYSKTCTITVTESSISDEDDVDEPRASASNSNASAVQPATPAETSAATDNKEIEYTGFVAFNNIDYELLKDGEASAVKSSNRKIKKAIIRDTVTIGGKVFKVTSIGKDAYKGFNKLGTVTIGENIRSIGTGAFKNCSSIKKITIKGNNLVTVGSGSFKGFKDGVKITIICKDKTTYDNLVKKIKKAGAKKAVFKFRKG